MQELQLLLCPCSKYAFGCNWFLQLPSSHTWQKMPQPHKMNIAQIFKSTFRHSTLILIPSLVNLPVNPTKSKLLLMTSSFQFHSSFSPPSVFLLHWGNGIPLQSRSCSCLIHISTSASLPQGMNGPFSFNLCSLFFWCVQDFCQLFALILSI